MTTSFSEIAADLDRLMAGAADVAGAFWRDMPAAFARILEDGLYKQPLNALLAGVRDKNLPITARHTAGQFIVLHSSPWSNWALIYHMVPARFLYLSPMDALQAQVAGAPLTVERFACPRPVAFDRLDPELALAAQGARPVAIGEVLARRGREEILDWTTAAGAARPGMTLRVNSGPLADFEWAFDRATMRPVGITPVDALESNLTTIFTLLAAARDPGSIAHLEPFLASERHFIRWKALQAIAAIDGARARAALPTLADDPHPEVRGAARQALEAA